MPNQCPPNTFLYTIQQNDDLIRIANRFDVSIAAILLANPQINYYSTLYVGNTLCIPSQPTRPPCANGTYYRIGNGETFYTIALDFNIPLSILLEANPGVDAERLYEGQLICIPTMAPPTRCPSNAFEYRIQAGDTFYKLAAQYNTTVKELIVLNPNLEPTNLKIGQKICIPRR